MNLKYLKVSLFEITYKKNELFHDILIYWDAPVLTSSVDEAGSRMIHANIYIYIYI